MTDSLGSVLNLDDYVVFPSHVGSKGVLRYGRIMDFTKTSRDDRRCKGALRCATAYADWETLEFGRMDRNHSVDPDRCVKITNPPAELVEVLRG